MRTPWWCRRPDSNRDGDFAPTDFKSDASTSSATSARHASNIGRRMAESGRSALAGVAPDLIPQLAGGIGHASVGLIELVRHLEDRQHQPALGAPGDVAAARLTPDEFARSAGDAGRRAFLV